MEFPSYFPSALQKHVTARLNDECVLHCGKVPSPVNPSPLQFVPTRLWHTYTLKQCLVASNEVFFYNVGFKGFQPEGLPTWSSVNGIKATQSHLHWSRMLIHLLIKHRSLYNCIEQFHWLKWKATVENSITAQCCILKLTGISISTPTTVYLKSTTH